MFQWVTHRWECFNSLNISDEHWVLFTNERVLGTGRCSLSSWITRRWSGSLWCCSLWWWWCNLMALCYNESYHHQQQCESGSTCWWGCNAGFVQSQKNNLLGEKKGFHLILAFGIKKKPKTNHKHTWPALASSHMEASYGVASSGGLSFTSRMRILTAEWDAIVWLSRGEMGRKPH